MNNGFFRLRSYAVLTLILFTLIADPTRGQTKGAGRAELPDTQAGRILREWFGVIERGNEEEIKRFVDTHFSKNAFRFQRSAADYIAFFRKLHEQSGGLEILQVTPQTTGRPLSIIAKSKRGEHFALVQAGLDHAEKEKLFGLGVEKAESPYAPKLSDIAERLSERQMIAAIRKDLDRRAAAGDFSGVVLIAKDDRVLLHQAYGFADRERKIRNTTNTAFHLASVGKMFTAVAIARLVNQGKLAYTDTIAKVFPEYPNKAVAEKVTIRQLLTHTAGFGTFFESPGFVKGKNYPTSIAEIPVYQDEKLFFEPGSRWRYSNAGYSLLGAIIERLTGKTYRQYIRETILDPLSLTQTDRNSVEKGDPNASIFYTQSPQDPLGLEPYLADKTLVNSEATGFGNGFSTARDLFKFLRAYRTGRLLNSGLIAEMVNSNVNIDDKGTRRYAYGIQESVSNGEKVRGHSGGGRTDAQMLWDSGYTVIVQINANPPSVTAVSNEIIDFITRQNAMRRATSN